MKRCPYPEMLEITFDCMLLSLGSGLADIKYLSNCDPVSDVALVIFCGLVKGKTLRELQPVGSKL